jgi:hypothetical protein
MGDSPASLPWGSGKVMDVIALLGHPVWPIVDLEGDLVFARALAQGVAQA